MKKPNKVLLILFAVLALVLIIALPLGAKLVRDEGWVGVWQRKRSNIEKVVPDAAPALDRVEKSLKDSGAIK